MRESRVTTLTHLNPPPSVPPCGSPHAEAAGPGTIQAKQCGVHGSCALQWRCSGIVCRADKLGQVMRDHRIKMRAPAVLEDRDLLLRAASRHLFPQQLVEVAPDAVSRDQAPRHGNIQFPDMSECGCRRTAARTKSDHRPPHACPPCRRRSGRREFRGGASGMALRHRGHHRRDPRPHRRQDLARCKG